MESINTGIIGGCMTCQTDLKLSQLFYRSFSQKLLEYDGTKCYVSLKYYNEYFRIPELARQLISSSRPDLIILQIRPAPFIMRSELLIQDYSGRFLINPLVFSSENIFKIESILGTKDPVFIEPGKLRNPLKRLAIMPVLRYNILAGRLFGLEKKAVRSAGEILKELNGICTENHVRLMVIGNISSYNVMHDHYLGRFNRAMKKLSDELGIFYLDIYSRIQGDPDRYFGPDRSHLNREGHELVAGLLFGEMTKQP